MKIAVVTNDAPPYRVPLFRLLSNELGATFFLHDCSSADPDWDFPFQLVDSVGSLRGALSAEQFDAVVAGLSGRSLLLATYREARRTKTPFLLWVSLWEHPRTLAHLLTALPAQRLYRRADAVVTYGPHVSRYISRYRRSNGVFEARQAVDNERFGREIDHAERQALRSELGLGDRPVVLVVARLVKEKGIEYLVEAWEQLQREIESQAMLVVVGDGPLKERFKSLPNAKLAGKVAPGRLPVFYAVASMLVLPSIRTRRFLEPWGLVINEGMNQGLPVVATDAVGAVAGGLVQDATNGLVVPERDGQALARAVGRLIEENELRQRLGRNAKQSVAAYTYSGMVDAFAQAIRWATDGQ